MTDILIFAILNLLICDEHAVTQMGADSFTYEANWNQATRNVGGNSYTLGYLLEDHPLLSLGTGLSLYRAEDEERAGIIISRVKKEFNLNHSILEDISYGKEKRRFVNFPPNSIFSRCAPGASRRAVLGEEG